jgi:hypothetical protein
MCGSTEQGGGSSAGSQSGVTEQKPSGGGSIPIGVPVSPEEFRRQKEEAAKPKSVPPREPPQKDK